MSHPGLPGPEEIRHLLPEGGPEFNRLIHESSPYLLQHARNPVDWRPWGADAFALAKSRQMPVFLSVGYSSCHWCHVMESESFEDAEVARYLNKHFICIKVDREERPDIDSIYMMATHLLAGQGGWPNSVWLTPEGKPWYAGTYFPRETRLGRPGFQSLLSMLAAIWLERRDEVERQAERILEAIGQMRSFRPLGAPRPWGAGVVDLAVAECRRAFDSEHGGFGGAPKFPPHGDLALLLHEYRRSKDPGIAHIIAKTLDAMAAGGIHDHIGGGFHRYSTDERWLVPHFEKMLYDNAQLLRVYAEAYLLLGRVEYKRIALRIVEWLDREMTHPLGGFFCALDADSEPANGARKEGAYYVWRMDEILEALGREEGELFCRFYSIAPGGNFDEEAAGRRSGLNIPHCLGSLNSLAEEREIALESLFERLENSRLLLLERRNQRPKPFLDDKILASWNGLMIGALAFAACALNEHPLLERAEKAARFYLAQIEGAKGFLPRSWRNGPAKISGYLDDYAFLAEGLLELFEASSRNEYLIAASDLASRMVDKFRDESTGGFFFVSSGHEKPLAPIMEPYDHSLPSSNGVAAMTLIRLGRIMGQPKYLEFASKALQHFYPAMNRSPRGSERLILATAVYFQTQVQITPIPIARVSSPEIAALPAKNNPQTPAWMIGARDSMKNPMRIEAVLSREEAAPGEMAHIALRVRLEEDWHVNSHLPKQDYLIPFRVEITKGGEDIEDIYIRYPEPHEAALGCSPDVLSIYSEEFAIQCSLKISAIAKPGPLHLQAKILAQICNNRVCLAPETKIIDIALRIVVPPSPADSSRES